MAIRGSADIMADMFSLSTSSSTSPPPTSPPAAHSIANKGFADVTTDTIAWLTSTNPPPPSPELPASSPSEKRKQLVSYPSSDDDDDEAALDRHQLLLSRPPQPPSSNRLRSRRSRKRRVVEDSSSDGGAPIEIAMSSAEAADHSASTSLTTMTNSFPTSDAAKSSLSATSIMAVEESLAQIETFDLYMLEPQDRFSFYSSYFTTAALSDFGRPELCNDFPGLEEEIFEAYTELTTFTATIWLNYDASEAVFFEGTRAQDCGKLRLPSQTYDALAALNPKILQLQHVRLDIGTPFRKLAEIIIHAKREDHCLQYDVPTVANADRVEHCHKFRAFLESTIAVILQTQVTYGKSGIAFRDLEMIAELFHRKRDEQPGWNSDWERKVVGGGEWTAPEVEPPSPPLLIRPWRSCGRGLRRTSSSRTLLAVDLSGGRGFGG